MNVVTIGGSDWTYVETLGGGQGASSSGRGDSGVHVGMSNTLNTPIEALEHATPLRVLRYAVRRGSGSHNSAGTRSSAGAAAKTCSTEALSAPSRLFVLNSR